MGGQGGDLVGAGGLVEVLAQGLQLGGQGDARCVVQRGLSRGFSCAGAACTGGPIGGEQHTAGRAHGAIGIGAQLKTHTAQTAPVVVRLVDEVAQVQLGGVLGGGQLRAQLGGGIVEHQLVEPPGAELFGLDAAQRAGVVLAVGPCVGSGSARAVPGRAVAGADAVALCARAMVAAAGQG